MSTVTQPAVIKNEPAAAYHAAKGVSRSQLWKFRERRQFATMQQSELEQSDSMRLGSLVHSMIENGGNMPYDFAEVPEQFVTDSGALSKSKAAKLWLSDQESLGVQVATGEDVRKARIISNELRLLLCDMPMELAIHERSIYWIDEESGLACKCRPDILLIGASEIACIDIKTAKASDPHAFTLSCETYGYHMQQAHYEAGISAAYGKPITWLFAVCETVEPYAAAMYRIDSEQAEAARVQWRCVLTDYANAKSDNDYVNPWHKFINTIKPRKYALEA